MENSHERSGSRSRVLRRLFLTAMLASIFGVIAITSFVVWEHLHRVSVVVLDDCDPNYKGAASFGDSVRLLSSYGFQSCQVSGLNNCQTIGAIHGVVVDPQRGRIYFRELVADRVTAIDLRGRVLFRADGVAASAMAVDPKSGELWCLVGRTIHSGEAVVLDSSGQPTASYSVVGSDIAYDSYSDAFWIVGREITKVDRKGRVLFRRPLAAWTCASVAPDPRDGSAWVVERQHPDVKGSVDRLVRLDTDGNIVKEVDLNGEVPFGVACDPKTGTAWVVGLRRNVLRVPVDGPPLPPLDIPARSVAIGPASAEIWVATEQEVLRLNDKGEPEARYRFAKPSSQSWLAAF